MQLFCLYFGIGHLFRVGFGSVRKVFKRYQNLYFDEVVVVIFVFTFILHFKTVDN